MAAGVIVLAGPSGVGKSRVAARLELPVLRLDDFYRDGTDPALPRLAAGANAGLVDWDDPCSWLGEDALACVRELCVAGVAEVPVYDLARNGRSGSRPLDLGGASFFLAEGIFAQEIVPSCAQEGFLGAAYCLTQHRAITFLRRLARDLRERRKPPLVLLRRGVTLMRQQQSVVDRAVALGCRAVSADEAYAEIRALATVS